MQEGFENKFGFYKALKEGTRTWDMMSFWHYPY
jgi:hypothetical protein